MDLTLTPDFAWEDKVSGYVEPFWVLVEDADSEALLYSQARAILWRFVECFVVCVCSVGFAVVVCANCLL